MAGDAPFTCVNNVLRFTSNSLPALKYISVAFEHCILSFHFNIEITIIIMTFFDPWKLNDYVRNRTVLNM
jgi:hypothetical protein